MDTHVKDMRGTRISVGDRVATAAVARRSGSGLRTGVITSAQPNGVFIKDDDSGRSIYRDYSDVVKVA
jgi:hypothetical protein